MKRISLIVPITKTNNDSKDTFSASEITEALSHIHHELLRKAIEYELILVSNKKIRISLTGVEVFPKYTQIKIIQQKKLNMSQLITHGISLAKFEYVGVLGCDVGYIPHAFKKMIADVGEENDVIASVKTTPSNYLPFFFNLQLNPNNATLLFNKNVWEVIHFTPKKDTFFISEFMKRSKEAGYSVQTHHFPLYSPGIESTSPPVIKTFMQATKDVLALARMKIAPIYVPSQQSDSMINAGIYYKKQQYITHTTLTAYNSALEAFDKRWQVSFMLLTALFLTALAATPVFFIQTSIALLSCIYLIDVAFTMFLVLKTLNKKQELSFTKRQLAKLDEDTLPIYSILCPLYKEMHVLPQFIDGIEKLDWPKDKLDVIILLESDDLESIKLFNTMHVPSYIRSVIVPNSYPKTKPKACNYGLGFVRGDYTVIYDAEDIPDPMQLKKAFAGFQQSAGNVACLQAKLSYYNVNQNLLTRFFTIEYSLWFDLTLAGLNSLKTVIPLGGTSNHFRTEKLKELHAWDPFNVTEDADLGMRLFKSGYRTAILDSVTLEEGNSNLKNWIRQRSRWLKGYMQTYLVHTKASSDFFKQGGIHALIFQLVIGGKIAFIIINPFLWISTFLYFGLHPIFGPTIDSLYPTFVLYVAILSLIFGNYLYLFSHVMGCVKREQWGLIKYVFLIPVYWIFISVAGFMALYQLIFKPFYWEKTIHGLHLKKQLQLGTSLTDVAYPHVSG